jgi:hypothetical protein
MPWLARKDTRGRCEPSDDGFDGWQRDLTRGFSPSEQRGIVVILLSSKVIYTPIWGWFFCKKEIEHRVRREDWTCKDGIKNLCKAYPITRRHDRGLCVSQRILLHGSWCRSVKGMIPWDLGKSTVDIPTEPSLLSLGSGARVVSRKCFCRYYTTSIHPGFNPV